MNFYYIPATNQALKELAALSPVLYEVQLTFNCENELTDDGVFFLSKVKSLRYIGLICSKITAKAIDSLATLPHLSALSLSELTQLNDSWIKRLSQLNTVRNLYLINTSLSDAGVDKLKRMMPNTEIITSFDEL